MQIKFTAQIQNKGIILPKTVLEKINLGTNFDVIIRPAPAPSNKNENKEQILEKITQAMNAKFSHFEFHLNEKLKGVAGISSDIKEKWKKFSDKELAEMGRMEKYMEKGEILESLY